MTQKSDARLARDAATDTTPLREMAQVLEEHKEAIQRVGTAQYHGKIIEQEVNMLNSRIYALNQEAAKIQEAAKLNEAKATTTTPVTTPAETIPSETL